MSTNPTVRDYMTPDVVSFRPGTDVHDAIGILLRHQVSGAPVLDKDENIVGVLSIKDCLNVAFSASYHREPGGRVSDIMSSPVQTIDADSDIIEVAEYFLNSQYRRFPVISKGNLVGVISRYDVLRALADNW